MTIRSTRLGAPFAGLFDRSRTQGTNTSEPTYSVSASVSSVNEGSSVTFTISTTGVLPGTTLYWTTNTVSGTINTSDFNDSVTTGSFVVSGTYQSGTGTVTRTLSNDLTTEGTESFQLQIRTESTSGTVVATSATITISDTSVETYSVSASTTSLNEGSSVTFTVTTGGVPNGTTLYWTTNTVSGTINTSDFNDSATSGSFTITTNSGTITRTLANDFTTEGSESFQIQIRTGSTSGTVVATSATVTIGDTSLTFTASGGSESTASRPGFRVHTFTGPGSLSVSGGPPAGRSVEYLVVAGGASGGKTDAGGGGAGGVRSGTMTLTPGTYPVTVGGGGAAQTGPSPGSWTKGNNGNPSQFAGSTTINATGGGGGGSGSGAGGGNENANPGGSGGGAGSTRTSTANRGSGNAGVYTPSEGNPGGVGRNPIGGGGGGGAGGPGRDGGTTPGVSGAGGSAISSSITGSSITYGGGGEAAHNPVSGGQDPSAGFGGDETMGPKDGGAAPANRGGGGGGGGGGHGNGGAGGSGVVIIAYPTAGG